MLIESFFFSDIPQIHLPTLLPGTALITALLGLHHIIVQQVQRTVPLVLLCLRDTALLLQATRKLLNTAICPSVFLFSF